MTIRIDNLGRVHGGGRRIARQVIALAYAAAAALVALASGADASASRIGGAWSSGFDDWAWTDTSLARPKTLSPLAGWAEQCLVDCGPVFGTTVVRRAELLSSNTADVSANTVADSTGHMTGMSGMTVIERLAPDGFAADPGSLTDWVVTGERTLDSDGIHSWSLLSPEISPDARWLPIEHYRFEDASLSMNFAAAASAGATPEASTWAMALVGFLWLSVAGYRSNRKRRRPVHFLEGIYPR
jgi:hypothetical protein